MFEKILRLLVDPKEPKVEAPEGTCPVCWGHQEYGNKIRKIYKDKQIDVNNHSANQSFIQEFVTTNLSGIQLKKNDHGFECPRCHANMPA